MSRCVFLWLCAFFNTLVFAAESANESSFSGEMSVGLGYDDRLRIVDARPTLYKSDKAALVDVSLEYESKFRTNAEVNLTYKFSQKEYDDIATSNTRYHYSLADFQYDFDYVRTGLTYSFLDFKFGGKSLLEVKQSGVYMKRFLGKKVFLNVEYQYSENDYDNFDHLASEKHSSGGEIIYYANRNSYLLVGYTFVDEKASLLSRNYDANKYKLQLVKRFKVGRYRSTFEAIWRIEDRDYSIVTKSIGGNRNDRRQRYKLKWKLPISKRLFTQFEVERSNYDSNIPSVNYVRNVVSIRIGVEF